MKIPTRAAAFAAALMMILGTIFIPAAAESADIVSGIAFISASGLNLRALPSIEAPVLATANADECVVVLDRDGEWYHVIYNLQEGYMSAEYLSVAAAENAELGYGTVTGTDVNLRSAPSLSGAVVGTASCGDRCYIIGLNQGWYKILYNSSPCYIRSDYLQLTEIPYENRSSSNSPKYFRHGKSIGAVPTAAFSADAVRTAAFTGTVSGAEILAKATEYLGTPYVYGGASPSGFDCSGFVYYVYGTFGIEVGRTPEDQYNAGSQVDKSGLQVGDIVLFCGTVGGGITHSGIYAGNGQFIHSPNSRSTVSYSDLTEGYWSEHFYCGIRVV